MLEGIVIKLYKGYYYVRVDKTTLTCRLPGKFRFKNQDIFVGDRVKVKQAENDTYVICEVFERQNRLLRPPVANVEQAVIVLAAHKPEANLELLDRLLVWAEYEMLNIVICLNKIDLAEERELAWLNVYKQAGYTTLLTSTVTRAGLKELKELFCGKISVLAGQSGVGKSSLLNALYPKLNLSTGSVSKKTGHGRHTTRHVELIPLDGGGFVADAPGFSNVDLPDIEPNELSDYFRDFRRFAGECRFDDCMHKREPRCAVKKALESGEISDLRYMNYLRFLNELTERKRRYR